MSSFFAAAIPERPRRGAGSDASAGRPPDRPPHAAKQLRHQVSQIIGGIIIFLVYSTDFGNPDFLNIGTGAIGYNDSAKNLSLYAAVTIR